GRRPTVRAAVRGRVCEASLFAGEEMKRPTRFFARLAVLGAAAVSFISFTARRTLAQRSEVPNSVSVFLDCGFMCDEEFIHTEMKYINWVRDRTAADVHLLVTTEGTGGGGTQFTLAFLGLQRFAGRGDTLHVSSSPTATSDETRQALVRVMKAGLVPF